MISPVFLTVSTGYNFELVGGNEIDIIIEAVRILVDVHSPGNLLCCYLNISKRMWNAKI